MAGPNPLPHKKIVKKRNTPFPRYQSDEFVKVRESWRRPRGIDSRHRCKAKGLTKTVKGAVPTELGPHFAGPRDSVAPVAPCC